VILVMQSTSASLLLRLKHGDDASHWERFVRLYTPLLLHWATRAGLQRDDAADLVQDVLMTLMRKMRDFDYDGAKSFRSWLRTVTLNHWRDRLKRRATRPLPTSDSMGDVEGEEGLARMIDAEFQKALTSRALELMQTEFQPHVWKACWEHAVQGRPASDVAAELGMTSGAVYTATSRVLARLRQELAGMLD
jgi:RNA polymerase sigma-70 factor (ECF subfamily)